MRHSQTSISEMASAINGTYTAARLWLEAGFSPGYAKAYVDAGCFDVDRTFELKRAGISPLDIARSGQAGDYCSGHISLSDLLDHRRPANSPEIAW